MAKTFKERLMERLPGTRIATEEARPRAPAAGGVSGAVQRVTGFLQEFRMEMKKVTWPNRKETVSSTAVVIATVMFIVLFLGLVDYALGRIIYSVLSF
jgi:preprotein translocase subunit SecE